MEGQGLPLGERRLEVGQASHAGPPPVVRGSQTPVGVSVGVQELGLMLVLVFGFTVLYGLANNRDAPGNDT